MNLLKRYFLFILLHLLVRVALAWTVVQAPKKRQLSFYRFATNLSENHTCSFISENRLFQLGTNFISGN